jgi:hypothetical protein
VSRSGHRQACEWRRRVPSPQSRAALSDRPVTSRVLVFSGIEESFVDTREGAGCARTIRSSERMIVCSFVRFRKADCKGVRLLLHACCHNQCFAKVGLRGARPHGSAARASPSCAFGTEWT